MNLNFIKQFIPKHLRNKTEYILSFAILGVIVLIISMFTFSFGIGLLSFCGLLGIASVFIASKFRE